MKKFYYITLAMLVETSRDLSYAYTNVVIGEHPFKYLERLQEYRNNIPKWVLINWKELSDEEYALAWETKLVKPRVT